MRNKKTIHSFTPNLNCRPAFTDLDYLYFTSPINESMGWKQYSGGVETALNEFLKPDQAGRDF